MITVTELTSAAVDEAAAIVEAEWMRLERHGAPSVDDHFARKQARRREWPTERSPPG